MKGKAKHKVSLKMLDPQKKDEEMKTIREMINSNNITSPDVKDLSSIIGKPLKPVEKSKRKNKPQGNNTPNNMSLNENSINHQVHSRPNTNTQGRHLDKFDKSILDDKEFRKTIKTEKIAIDCEASSCTIANEEYKPPLVTAKSLFYFNNEEEEENLNDQEQERLFLQVHEFLSSIDMEQYLEVFLSNGITSLGKVIELNEGILKQLPIPYGHRIKILKKIREANQGESNINQTVRDYTANDYEELKPQVSIEQDEKEKEQRIIFQQAIADFRNVKNSNVEAEEAAQADLFKKAVEQFRGGHTHDVINSEVNTCNLLNENSNEITPFEYKMFLPSRKLKTMCWMCYKIILQEAAIIRYDKPFCSEKCFQLFENEHIVTCNYCSKEYLKSDSIFHKAKAYCSPECYENTHKELEDEESLCTINNNPHGDLQEEEVVYDILNI